MTKQELLTALEAKENVLAIVQTSEAQTQPDGTNRYVVTLKVQTSAGGINYTNHAFYVENEGQENEQAFYENQEPYATAQIDESFRSKVETFIASKITDNTIKGAVITDINEVNRCAFVKAVLTADSSVITALIADANNDGILELTVTA